MEALEVCHLGRIARLDEHLKARLHQLADTAHEDALLTEKILLRLIAERRLQYAGTRCAKAACIGEREIEALARLVLFDGEYGRNARALLERAADEVTGALRRNHEHIDALGRNNLLEMDVEAVSKGKRTALLEVRADLFLVNIRLLLIGDEHHRNICLLHRIGNRRDLQTMCLSLRLGL